MTDELAEAAKKQCWEAFWSAWDSDIHFMILPGSLKV